MVEGFSNGVPSPEIRPEMGDTNAGIAVEATPVQQPVKQGETLIDPKESLISKLLQTIPEDQRETMEYGYRHLPEHMRAAGMTEEEVQAKLDEIKFPNELR